MNKKLIDEKQTIIEVAQIDPCARCGKKHIKLKFKKLEHDIVVNDCRLTHWCECPTNGEPIVMLINNNL